MPYKKLLAGASLVLLAFAAIPAAYAANDGDSSTPSQAAPAARPHHAMDPAKRAALKAKRQARRQARQQQMQGTAPN
jgi:hypothetical protein